MFSTRDGLALPARTKTSVDHDNTSSFVHYSFRSQFCSVGLSLTRDRGLEGLKEPKTGFSFPGELCFRSGQTNCPRITGVGARQKRLAGIKNLNVYALALYVDQAGTRSLLRDAIAHENEDVVCRNDAMFTKIIQNSDVEKVLRMVISSSLVKRNSFLKALDERLQPAVKDTKSEETLATFRSMFDDVSFRKGLDVSFFFQPGGDLVAKADGKELGRLKDPNFSREILNIYLGKDPVSSQAKEAFGRGIYKLVTEGNLK